MLLWIPSFGQTVSNDTCFTTAEVNFFIQQSFTIAEQNSALETAKEKLWNDVIIQDSQLEQINECHKQLKLEQQNVKDCKDDCSYDIGIRDKAIKTLERKSKSRKVLNFVLLPITLVESGILGFQYLLKK